MTEDDFTEQARATIHDAAAAHVADDRVPGLVALVAHGDAVHVETLGHLSVGGPAVRRDSLFRIASTTKPITAAATLALVSEGLLDLDEPVDHLLPELADRRVLRRADGPLDDTVPARRAITTRDLLTFTFGFGMTVDMFTAATPWPVVAAADQLELATLGPPNPDGPPEPDVWMTRFASLPLLAQPGERWFYNTGAAVLGVLLARAAGQPLEDVLRTRLFEPLGMRDTGFWAGQTERLATAYAGGGPSGSTGAGLSVWDEPAGQWSRPPAFPDAAAGLVSTVDDLHAFARMLLAGGGDVVRPDLVVQMTTDQLTPEQRTRDGRGFLDGRSWGFGVSMTIDGPRRGAFGWDGGLGTSWLVDPARHLVVIVLTQRLFDSPATPQVHLDIQHAAYAAVG